MACGAGLCACSGGSMPTMEMPKATPSSLTLQFESEPKGAEAKTSTGQTCRTPCSASVPMSGDITVSFALNGYLPQTVPVRLVPPEDPRSESEVDANWQFRPNPVYAELEVAPPPPKKKAAPAKKEIKKKPAPKQTEAPAPTAARTPAQGSSPAMSASPGLPPASPWPTR
jgi:hypothetical protein